MSLFLNAPLKLLLLSEHLQVLTVSHSVPVGVNSAQLHRTTSYDIVIDFSPVSWLSHCFHLFCGGGENRLFFNILHVWKLLYCLSLFFESLLRIECWCYFPAEVWRPFFVTWHIELLFVSWIFFLVWCLFFFSRNIWDLLLPLVFWNQIMCLMWGVFKIHYAWILWLWNIFLGPADFWLQIIFVEILNELWTCWRLLPSNSPVGFLLWHSCFLNAISSFLFLLKLLKGIMLGWVW